jgi:hypothetical protein
MSSQQRYRTTRVNVLTRTDILSTGGTVHITRCPSAGGTVCITEVIVLSTKGTVYIASSSYSLCRQYSTHHKQYIPSQQVVPQIKLVWFWHVCNKNTVLTHPVLPITDLLAPVRVRKEHCSCPPRPPCINCVAMYRPIIIYQFFSKIIL